MIRSLTRNPIYIKFKRLGLSLFERLKRLGSRGDRRGIALKVCLFLMMLGLGLMLQGSIEEFKGVSADQSGDAVTESGALTMTTPLLIWQGVGAVFAVIAFVVSLFANQGMEERRRGLVIVVALSFAALASLVAWLPTDVLATKQAISGKALAGETPSIPAYLGKVFFITVVILSIPVAAMIYFRLSIMDRYVVHSFLSPFFFCLFSFMAVWMIADLTDNAPAFTGLPLSRLMIFYVVQFPYVILFVMPIVILLSALFSLSKMSKANEFISMVGSGRSVFRVLLPIFVIGAYSSLICLAFKYDWAPSSVGFKEALMQTAKAESAAIRHGKTLTRDVWSKRGWMHVNEVDRRTWFVGKVPYTLSDEMAEVVVWQLRENDQPEMVWKASRAKWVWNSTPPKWVFSGASVYRYDEDQIPRITNHETLEIMSWSETPWVVLSSSQNPDFLGIPGLAMYLNAHSKADQKSLAPFRTNWWYVFAEPAACLALVLVAAPLGIVYSRKGVMGGVAVAIGVFALMYVMRGSFLALGHRGDMSPIIAAWGTNLFVAGIGALLLWYRARNRDVPKISEIWEAVASRVQRPGKN
ncbi:MAG: LptF/LptG family permease [Verrucomicrobiota bacterium]